ncbi:oxygen-binding di-iron domain-containing protein [Tenggerimyces flavus]|uniref:MBL fold metallo-hydrolase n=1 Tax=Tenggerimyces flavus TaxID=1708749 RepID=A0ABV7YGJ2_9ACTN|nr:MBL fold metallo-hydrolase [Tenggerimyces flavus]MBM7790964.1 glyoxylase-like metal-dependent hydrolase (beta-lactamase superfamily II) [Tenggerimyces flavus]
MELVRSAPDVTTLADAIPIPDLGFVPVNAFLLRAEQPVLVDAGLTASSPEFLAKLSSLLDPADLRWIYLTHPDRDHTGSIRSLLDLAPRARLVTTFMGMGILSLEEPIPPERVFLLNPGQTLDVGDRQLTCFRPPLYDSPATTGFYDSLTGTCFSSDCFGAPVASADLAHADDIAAVPPSELVAGQRLWATVDSPWVTGVDRTAFRASLEPLRRLAPPVILSSHLPAAHNATTRLLEMLEQAPEATPYVGPDQAALEAMLAAMEPRST